MVVLGYCIACIFGILTSGCCGLLYCVFFGILTSDCFWLTLLRVFLVFWQVVVVGYCIVYFLVFWQVIVSGLLYCVYFWYSDKWLFWVTLLRVFLTSGYFQTTSHTLIHVKDYMCIYIPIYSVCTCRIDFRHKPQRPSSGVTLYRLVCVHCDCNNIQCNVLCIYTSLPRYPV